MSTRRKEKPAARRSASVDTLRAEIDRLDDRLLNLLNRRAALAIEIGRRKARAGRRVFAPEREQRILSRLVTESRGPLRPAMVQAVFREVIAGCRLLEQRLRVVFLGPDGTFSHRAARQQFGSATDLLGVDSIAAVFAEVEHDRADYGVVPVENSTQGVVTETLDRFVSSPLTIKTEALFPIRLMLLSRSGRRDRVRRIVSMTQPLAQCRRWLATHFPGVPVEEVSSTARAAEIAAKDAGAAAVAGTMVQGRYPLQPIARNVQDQARNFTRFLIIGREGIGARSGDDKTSLLFLVRHEAGALQGVLQAFSRHRINLLTLESRPLQGRPWEYMFFLDVDGHIQEPKLQRVVEAVRPRCLSLRVLGSYPVSRVVE